MTARDGVAVQALPVVRLHVNRAAHELVADPGRRLSDVLRDDLHLTGTKVGCHAGDCGACTVLLDGEQVCSCIVALGQCEGRSVVTVEGLAEADGALSPLQRAFVAFGAAQCGICTPGMLMSAEALLRRQPHPGEAEVLDALGGVLCRCTGYRKIVEAVLSVSRAILAPHDAPADPRADVPASALGSGEAVGARVERLDAPDKVRGVALYGADTWPTDALAMRVVRSPHPHARFTLGDLAAFKQRWPGLTDVLVAADVANNAFAIFPDLRDQPVLADGEVRFRGEAVLALVGDEATVRAIADVDVPIEYSVLPASQDITCALAAGQRGEPVQQRHADNLLCRGRVVFGDVDTALATAPVRVTAQFETSYVEHAYIEPEAGYAEPVAAQATASHAATATAAAATANIAGTHAGPALPRVRIFACTQTPYMDRDEVAHVLGVEPGQVHIVPSAMGGGFGGKLDLSVQPLLAVAALKLGRAVRLVYTRPESMQASTKRHPSRLRASAGCDADGKLVAYDFEGDFNTGAYSSW